MKNKMVIMVALLLGGCSNLKYPNWQVVQIVDTVDQQPCELKLRPTELCDDDDCTAWLKKRATIYGANTVVKNEKTGGYFYCAPGISLYVDPNLFLGWDENGHKKSNTNSGQKKASNDKNATNSTILNEDTIICETADPLLTTGNDFIKNVENNKFTGTFLFDGITTRLESIKNSIFESQLSNITQSTHDIGVYSYAERDRRDMAREQNQLSKEAQSTKEIEDLSKFLKSCTVNKEAQHVEIIESKPISKVAKIKVKLNDGFYELWTYDAHLTLPGRKNAVLTTVNKDKNAPMSEEDCINRKRYNSMLVCPTK